MKAFNYLLFIFLTLNVFAVRAQCQLVKIPRDNWSLVSVSSEETVGEGPTNGKAIYCFDGDNNTYWHTKWKDITPQFPHEIVINLGSLHNVAGISVLSRHNSGTAKPKGFQLFLSQDGNSWGSAQDLGNFSYTSVSSPSQVAKRNFGAVKAQYIKLIYTSDYSNEVHCVTSELDVYEVTGIGCEATGQNNQQISISPIPKKETNSAPVLLQATATSGFEWSKT